MSEKPVAFLHPCKFRSKSLPEGIVDGSSLKQFVVAVKAHSRFRLMHCGRSFKGTVCIRCERGFFKHGFSSGSTCIPRRDIAVRG